MDKDTPIEFLSLREAQSRFCRMLADLIKYAYDSGYELTVGDAYRDPRAHFPYGHPKSLHKRKLAMDFNLFRDGNFLGKTEDHEPLGEYWESIGGSWGGRFGDGNHYSLAWGGVK